jgi:hypothetical protein
LALLVQKYMATLKQIEANRRNALKSTGPRTPEGKAAVRLNSLRHGLRARTVVLPGESHEEFNQLCDDLEAEWRPESRSAQAYLEQMAISQWKLMRMEVSESNIYQDAPIGHAPLPILDRLWQAQSRLERSYARALRELQWLQNHRARQASQPRQEEQAESPAPQPPSPDVTEPQTGPNAPSLNATAISSNHQARRLRPPVPVPI